jgi:hypothetical protein
MKLTGVNNQPYIRETTSGASQAGLPGGAAGDSAGPGGVAAAATISKPAEVFNKLRLLKDKDRDAFTEVVSTLTEKLKTAAAQHEADLTGPFLSDLASKFEEVANGGDLAALQGAPLAGGGASAGTTPWQPAVEVPGQRPSLDQVFATITVALDQALK